MLVKGEKKSLVGIVRRISVSDCPPSSVVDPGKRNTTRCAAHMNGELNLLDNVGIKLKLNE